MRQRIFKIGRPQAEITHPTHNPAAEVTNAAVSTPLNGRNAPPYTPREKPTSRYSSRLPKPTSTDDKYSKRASTRDIGITIDRVPDPIHGRRTPCHCQRNPLAKIYATPNASLGTTVRRTQQRQPLAQVGGPL